jgi:hypothetical protein
VERDRDRFRAEFKPAFAAWIATNPLTTRPHRRVPSTCRSTDSNRQLASALLFAGISTKLHTETARRVVLGIGWLMFLGTAIWLATLPVQVTG